MPEIDRATLGEARATAIQLWRDGRLQDAIHCLQKEVNGQQADALLWNDLGVLCFLVGKYAEAENAFSQCLEMESQFPAALRGKAESLLKLGEHIEALKAFRSCLVHDASNLSFKLAIAKCLVELGELDQARDFAETCLSDNRHSVPLLLLLAKIYQRQSRPGKVVSLLSEAVALHPQDADGHAQLAMAHWEFGRTDDAMSCLQEAMRLGGPSNGLRFNLSWLILHDACQSAVSLRSFHEQAIQTLKPGSSAPAPSSGTRPPGRQLRVGFLSGESSEGPSFRFTYSWLWHLNKADFFLTFYSNRKGLHASPYRAVADTWRNISSLNDSDLVAMIRRDRLDVLVDLSGHFDGNRLAVFRERPAPVQVLFPNYPCTSGLSEMDYILTDHWVTPTGSEAEYTEKAFRLASGCLAYEPPAVLPEIVPPPLENNGYITFGLFQRPGKYHSKFWDVVGRVMNGCSGSKLLMHFGSADLDDEHSDQRAYLSSVLQSRGVDSDRLMFRGYRKGSEHFQVVSLADIALDSFPYAGQTTTCGCLWMGVPVVTEHGSTHVSRVGSSLLQRMGLADLVARSDDHYVQAAVHLAHSPALLSKLRTELRPAAKIKIGDGKKLAAEISVALRWMCRQQGHEVPSHSDATTTKAWPPPAL